MIIQLEKQPKKYLASVDKATRAKLYRALEQLKHFDEAPFNGNIVKLKGTPDLFRYKLDTLPEEEPDELDLAMLAEAQEINDGSTITLEEFQKHVGDYSGKLNIRIPRSLHRRLSQEAKDDGVSLSQYILYKLAQ